MLVRAALVTLDRGCARRDFGHSITTLRKKAFCTELSPHLPPLRPYHIELVPDRGTSALNHAIVWLPPLILQPRRWQSEPSRFRTCSPPLPYVRVKMSVMAVRPRRKPPKNISSPAFTKSPCHALTYLHSGRRSGPVAWRVQISRDFRHRTIWYVFPETIYLPPYLSPPLRLIRQQLS